MPIKLIEEDYTYYLCPVCEDWFHDPNSADRHCAHALHDTPNVARQKEKKKAKAYKPDDRQLYGPKHDYVDIY